MSARHRHSHPGRKIQRVRPRRPAPLRHETDCKAVCDALFNIDFSLVEDAIRQRLKRTGTPAPLIHAFIKTRQFVTLKNADKWAAPDLAAWGAALRDNAAGTPGDRWYLTVEEISVILGAFQDAHRGYIQ